MKLALLKPFARWGYAVKRPSMGAGHGRRNDDAFVLPGPTFSPPEADANRQARPTESATRGRSFRHPLPKVPCGSGTWTTATRSMLYWSRVTDQVLFQSI